MFVRPSSIVKPPDAALWYDRALPLALGCTVCPDLGLCGGLRINAGAFDCRSLCACVREGRKCSGVCRGDHRTFVRRVREVRGFGFDDVPHRAPLPIPALPEYVPIIYDGTDRTERLAFGTVALPLLTLFDRPSGTERFDTREGMLASFGLSPGTRVILTGVDIDRSLERWWSFGDRPRLIANLHSLGVDMVTSPNFSLFTDVTRHDNLHNMKRIALTWAEFMAGGIACALHVNARTDTDSARTVRRYVAALRRAAAPKEAFVHRSVLPGSTSPSGLDGDGSHPNDSDTPRSVKPSAWCTTSVRTRTSSDSPVTVSVNASPPPMSMPATIVTGRERRHR